MPTTYSWKTSKTSLVSRWMSSNRLELNSSKTELIWFYSGRRQLNFVEDGIVLFGIHITPVHTVRDLNVMLDSNMTMSPPVLRVCQNCYSQLRLIRRLGKALSFESTLLLVHMRWFIVGWITVIVFLRKCLGLLSSNYSPWWILLLVWFLAWSDFDHIYTRSDGFALAPIPIAHYSPTVYDYVQVLAWFCPLLILLTIALVLLWCLVNRLWDLLQLHGDIVVPSHRTDRGLRSFAVTSSSSWNVLPVGLRSSSFGLDKFRVRVRVMVVFRFAKHLKTSIWFSVLTTEHALLSLYYILYSATQWQCHQTRLLFFF